MIQLHWKLRFLRRLGLAEGAKRMDGLEVMVNTDRDLPLGLLTPRSLLTDHFLVDHLLELQVLDLQRVDLLEYVVKEWVLLVGGSGGVQTVLVSG